jgi:hypothetical protein
MNQAPDIFYVSFHEDTTATPPLKLVLADSLTQPMVNQDLSAARVLQYAQPNLGEPGANQTPLGEDLGKAAQSLHTLLTERGIKEVTLKPAEDGHVTLSPDGAMRAETPGSWEVVHFIACTLARLRTAAKTE